MRVYVGGAGGRVGEVAAQSGNVRRIELDTEASVSAVACDGGRLYALAGDVLWVLGNDDEDGAPKVVGKKPLTPHDPADLCVVPSADRTCLALAVGSGLLFLDGRDLATVASHSVRDGVGHVRAAGEDSVVYASLDGYVSRHRIGGDEVEPYFVGQGLGGIGITDLYADEKGGVCTGNRAGYVTWYEAPGAPAGQARVAHQPLGGVALAEGWVLATLGAEISAQRRRGDGRVILATEPATAKTRVLACRDQIAVLGQNGGLHLYDLVALRPGERVQPSMSIQTGIRETHALCWR
ncbi:MAG: hypothetical protein JSV86_00370 [Gemmatimonadota bacterium]|nr:MAG: hypothetical protein JSV86_00370 [Gemmatimonadota bacterium]